MYAFSAVSDEVREPGDRLGERAERNLAQRDDGVTSPGSPERFPRSSGKVLRLRGSCPMEGLNGPTWAY
jgi:hypothetical protein